MRLLLPAVLCALLAGCGHPGAGRAGILPPPASGELPVQADAPAQPQPATPSGPSEDLTRPDLQPAKPRRWRLGGEISIGIVHED